MKSYFNHRVLTVGAPLVTALWFLAVIKGGDTINAASIEPLFTGLALVAVIAAFVQEREQSWDRDKEHRELINEMRRAYQVDAISTKLARIDARKMRAGGHIASQSGMLQHLFGRDSTSLEVELDRIIGLPPLSKEEKQ